MPRYNSLVLENVLCHRQFNFAFSALFLGKNNVYVFQGTSGESYILFKFAFSALFLGKNKLTFIYSRGQVIKLLSLFLSLCVCRHSNQSHSQNLPSSPVATSDLKPSISSSVSSSHLGMGGKQPLYNLRLRPAVVYTS